LKVEHKKSSVGSDAAVRRGDPTQQQDGAAASRGER